ncbi:MAG: DegV family protein, partial [Oscillospiraceae bacterium]
MLWNIIADSSSDLVQKDYASSEYGFETVPLKISVDDRQFTDNEDINVEQLLSDMNKSKTASGSACPSPDEFKTAFMKADNTLCITISAALSGTFSCACVARDMVHETNPEKNICIINSKATAGVLELFVRKAIMLIGQKLPFEVVAERL